MLIQYIVLLGEEEFDNNEFILKNMKEGTQKNYKISKLLSFLFI